MLRLLRAPWAPTPLDRWFEAPTPESIVARLAPFRRVFVTLGRDHLAPFRRDAGRRYFFRVRAAAAPPPEGPITFVAGEGPFTVAGERALFERLGVEALATRNDGLRSAAPKALAARALGLPVFMLSRPPARAPWTTSPRRAAEWAAAAWIAESRARSDCIAASKA